MASRQPADSRRIIPERPRLTCGVLPEPHLVFGGGHRHIDPKTGLALYGPYSLADQDAPTTGRSRSCTRPFLAWPRKVSCDAS